MIALSIIAFLLTASPAKPSPVPGSPSATTRSLDAELVQVAAKGDTAAVEQLLQKGASVDAIVNTEGSVVYTGSRTTALIAAAKEGYVEVVKLLLKRGADIEKRGNGPSALSIAAEHGRADVVRLLLEKDAKLGDNCLFTAVEGHNAEIVKLFLAKGANIEARDSNDSTPLSVAAGLGNLVRCPSADDPHRRPNCNNNGGACCSGGPEVVQLLLNKGANVEARNNGGATPLLMAAYFGHVEVVKRLLAKGANIKAKDNKGNTALALALGYGHAEVAKLLRDRGAPIQ